MSKKAKTTDDVMARSAAARFYLDVLRELNRAFEEVSKERGISKSDIAAKLNVHKSSITRILSGERGNMTLGTIGALAGAMRHYPVFHLAPFDIETPGDAVSNEGRPRRSAGPVFVTITSSSAESAGEDEVVGTAGAIRPRLRAPAAAA